MAKVNGQVFTLQRQILMRDFVKLYQSKHLPTLALGPRQNYESLLKIHIVPAFENWRLCDIGTESVQDFLNAKKSEGLSWWTRNDLKGILSGVFTRATEWGYWTGKNSTQNTSVGPRNTKRRKLWLDG